MDLAIKLGFTISDQSTSIFCAWKTAFLFINPITNPIFWRTSWFMIHTNPKTNSENLILTNFPALYLVTWYTCFPVSFDFSSIFQAVSTTCQNNFEY